jgi:hypothetical protein
MHARAPLVDSPSPSPTADLILVAALLGVLTSLAWGVIWVQNAAAVDAEFSPWLGAVPPAAAALSGGALLLVRSSYAGLERLRAFLSRIATIGLGGAAFLALSAAWIVVRAAV